MGIILFSRVKIDSISYRNSIDEMNRESELMKSAYEEFSRKYGSKRLEWLYEEEIKNGSEFSKRISDEISLKVGLKPTREMILMGMMAESCKIPQRFIDGGISSPARFKMTDQQFDDYSKKYLSFIRWYNKKLRTNGMEQDLLYVKNDRGNWLRYKHDKECCHDIWDVDNPRYQGVYFWWDARMYTTPLGHIIN